LKACSAATASQNFTSQTDLPGRLDLSCQIPRRRLARLSRASPVSGTWSERPAGDYRLVNAAFSLVLVDWFSTSLRLGGTPIACATAAD